MAFVLLSTVVGCETAPPPPAEIAQGLIVTYQPFSSGPPCWGCDSLSLTVSSDGRVWIEKERLAGIGSSEYLRKTRRLERVAPERVAAFFEQLEPYRPHGMLELINYEDCADFQTDLVDGHIVSWRERGVWDRLVYDHGCDPEARAGMREALVRAPEALGLGKLLAPPQRKEVADSLIVEYRTSSGPFCGRCETLGLTVSSDGRVWIVKGHWAGDPWTDDVEDADWRATHRLEHVSPERVAEFLKRLEPYRPHGTLKLDHETCAVFHTDRGGLSVSWRGRGAWDQLFYDYGCDLEARADMREALGRAPEALGLGELLAP